jgi:2'-5' RNA ligase
VGASGVVALLDERHNEAVEQIWIKLSREAGVRRPEPALPHFSYHVAERYDVPRLGTALRGLAANSKPFRAWTSGLGVFTQPVPVLYIALVRSPELSRYQRWAWWEVHPTASGSLDYYLPERWVPHITLAQQGLTTGKLAEAVHLLAGQNFHWPIEIDNVAYVDGSQPEHKLQLKLKLGEEARD